MAFGVGGHVHGVRPLSHGDQGALRISSSYADQLLGLGIRQRNKQNPIHKTENCGVDADAQGQCEHGDRGEGQRLTQRTRAKANIRKKVFEGGPAPHFAAVLLHPSYISKFPTGKGSSFLSGPADRNQFLDPFLKVRLNLFGKIVVQAATGKELLEPVHDSPRAKTRVMPSSIFSKRDTSCSKCLAPAAVNL